MADLRTELIEGHDALAYHRDPFGEPSLSPSLGQVLNANSPLHCYHQHPRFGDADGESSDDFDTGTLWHALLLGRGEERLGVIRIKNKKTGEWESAENFKTDAAKAARDELRAAGKTPALQKDVDDAVLAVGRISAQLIEHECVLGSKREVVLLWVEEATDGTLVQCRCMLDALELQPEERWFRIQEFKTCKSAHPRAVRHHIEAYGYHVQAAAGMSAIEHVFPELQGRGEYEWIFAEKAEPNAVSICPPAGSMSVVGGLLWRRAVDGFARCMSEGKWPGYGRIGAIEASPWVIADATEGAQLDG